MLQSFAVFGSLLQSFAVYFFCVYEVICDRSVDLYRCVCACLCVSACVYECVYLRACARVCMCA